MCACVCKGSEIAQKQNKFEQAVHEMSCGVAEDTFKCPRVRNEPFHCPHGRVVAMKRGEVALWKMGNMEGNRPKRKKTWTRGHRGGLIHEGGHFGVPSFMHQVTSMAFWSRGGGSCVWR